ncbi:30S ribosomal protein S17 [Candidatus Methylocalor cossyra]|uniref:30S ribosomal protein S17 n=1 Tax=Candidatus Methylocalor cossyra TaxID=3108543 RepID=UPI0032B21F4F
MKGKEGNRYRLLGRVVSCRMDKTRSVEVERLVRHKLYGKYIKRSLRLLVHDEANESREGDIVSIVPCRPISKRKAWKLQSVINKSISPDNL